MESTQHPRYAPGDRVILSDPALGWADVPGVVMRILTIAQQPHQSARYLYALRLDHNVSTVYVPEEVLSPAERAAS